MDYKSPMDIFNDPENWANPNDSQQQIIKWVTQKISESIKHKAKFPDWEKNRSSYFPGAPKGIHTQDLKPEKLNLKNNLIFKNARTIIDTMTDQKPRPIAIPNSESEEDSVRAEKLEKCFQFVWRERKVLSKLRLMILHSLWYSIGWLKVFWNPSINQELGGDIDIIAVNPKEMHFDPSCKNYPDDCEWVAWERLVPKKWIREVYKKGYLVETDSGLQEPVGSANNPIPTGEVQYAGSPDLDRIDLAGNTLFSNPSSYPDGEMTGKVRFIEFFVKDYTMEEKVLYYDDKEKAKDSKGNIIYNISTGKSIIKKVKKEYRFLTPKYPGGRLIIVGGNEVLFDGKNPYDHGQFPFIPYLDIDVGEGYGITEIGYARHMQEALDKVFTMIHEYSLYAGNPAWIVDDGALKDNRITQVPGVIIPVLRPGARVDRIPGAPLPNHMFAWVAQLMNSIGDYFGTKDIMTGGRSGLRSAPALDAVQEAAQLSIRSKMNMLDLTFLAVGRQLACLMQQFYKSTRVFRILGEDNIPEKFIFSSEGMYGTWDLNISFGATLSFNRTMRQEMAFRLYQVQAIDQEALLESHDFPNRQAIIRRMDEKQAQALQQQQEMFMAQQQSKMKAQGANIQTPSSRQPRNMGGQFTSNQITGSPAEAQGGGRSIQGILGQMQNMGG